MGEPLVFFHRVDDDAEAARILNRAAEAGVFDDLIQDPRDNPCAYVLIHDRVIELIGRMSGVDWKVPHWEPRPTFGVLENDLALSQALNDVAEGMRRLAAKTKTITFTVGGLRG
jgi:hypothetical protein